MGQRNYLVYFFVGILETVLIDLDVDLVNSMPGARDIASEGFFFNF